MRVLTLVPLEAANQIASAIGANGTLVRARDAAQLLRELDIAAPSAVVIDPRLIPPARLESLIHALRLAGAPLLAHTALTSAAMRALLAVSRAGVREVLISGVDDDPASIRRVLDLLTGESLGGRVLSCLAPSLAAMPDTLRAAVTAMFLRPDAADTPHRLAGRAGITRRSLDRWVARSGLASARLLVAAPKLLIAYGQLRRAELSMASVAARAGYGSARSLERQCEALLGMRPAVLRTRLTPEAFAQALARGLVLGERFAGAAAPDESAAHQGQP
jgi:hypothetical protein